MHLFSSKVSRTLEREVANAFREGGQMTVSGSFFYKHSGGGGNSQLYQLAMN